MFKFKCWAFALCCTALGTLPASGQESIEGTWKGDFPVGGMIGSFITELESTTEGGLLTFHRNFMSCKYAYAPKDGAQNGVFERVLISAQHVECAAGDISISGLQNDTVKLEFIGLPVPPVILNKTGGPNSNGNIESKVKLLGFGLTDELDSLKDITNAPVFSIATPRKQTQGMRGNLSSYANVILTQAEWRLSGSETLSQVAYDVIAAYKFDAETNASAVTRVWLPEPQDAPTFDATAATLQKNFGPESQLGKNGTVGIYLTWNFDTNGSLVSGNSSHACNRSNREERTILILRYVGSDVRLVPGNDVMIMGVPAGIRRIAKDTSENFQVEPKPGCGITLTYYLQKRENGGLKKLTAVAYEHGSFLNSRWNAERERISQEAQRIVGTAKAQQSNAPKL